MTSRRTLFVSFAAILAIATLGWLAISQSGRQSPQVPTGSILEHPSNKPFRDPYPGATEVRLFIEARDGRGEPALVNPAGRVLTEKQRVEFESLIAIHTISPEDMFAACFIPHHFFRYFDGEGKLVGEIEVCFCCAGVQQSEGSKVRLSEGQTLLADFPRLESFVTSLGERTDVGCD